MLEWRMQLHKETSCYFRDTQVVNIWMTPECWSLQTWVISSATPWRTTKQSPYPAQAPNIGTRLACLWVWWCPGGSLEQGGTSLPFEPTVMGRKNFTLCLSWLVRVTKAQASLTDFFRFQQHNWVPAAAERSTRPINTTCCKAFILQRILMNFILGSRVQYELGINLLIYCIPQHHLFQPTYSVVGLHKPSSKEGFMSWGTQGVRRQELTYL